MPGVCQVVKLLSIQEFLEVTKNTNGLASVMGHEIAHAVANILLKELAEVFY